MEPGRRHLGRSDVVGFGPSGCTPGLLVEVDGIAHGTLLADGRRVGPGSQHGIRRLRCGAPEGRSRGVDAASDPDGAALLDFVGHRIRQRLHRDLGWESVAVAVEQAVQLGEGQRTVALQDGERRPSERRAADLHGVHRCRRDGRSVDLGATTSVRAAGWVEVVALAP